jgi:hypothetical protein
MPWTYNPLTFTDKDRVRLRIGDTDQTAPLLQDEEIADLLASYSLGSATAQAALIAAASLARTVNQSISGTVGGGSSNKNSRFTNLLQIAALWETKAGGVGAVLAPVTGFAGGISQATKDTQTADTDRVVPAFTRNLFENE